jgi:hypothetical protein
VPGRWSPIQPPAGERQASHNDQTDENRCAALARAARLRFGFSLNHSLILPDPLQHHKQRQHSLVARIGQNGGLGDAGF